MLFKLGMIIIGKDGETLLANQTGHDATLVTFKQGGVFSKCEWILTYYRFLRKKKKVNATIICVWRL